MQQIKFSGLYRQLAFIGVVLLGFSLTAVLFDESFKNPDTFIPSSYPDAFHFVWNGWYLRKALLTGEPIYSTQLIFRPMGARLELHTLTEGVVAPLAALFKSYSPIALYSLASAICFALNWVMAVGLFFVLSGSLPAAVLLSAVLTFHPFFIAHLAGGHLNMLVFFPVLLWGFAAAVVRIRLNKLAFISTVATGAAAVALLPFTNLYYFYFLLLASGILIAISALDLSKNKRLVAYIVLSITFGVLLSFPRLLHTAELGLSGEYTSNHDPDGNNADIMHYMLPGEFNATSKFFNSKEVLSQIKDPNSSETGLFFGVSLIALLSFVLFRSKQDKQSAALAVCSLIFLLLSLGPHISIDGSPITMNPVYKALSWVPLFPSVPARFGILAIFFALLSAASLHSNLKRGKVAVILLMVILIAEEYPTPIRGMEYRPSPALLELRRSAVSSVIDTGEAIEPRMIRQVFHEKPITEGFLARAPRTARKFYRSNAFLRYLNTKRDPTNISAEEAHVGFKLLETDAVLVESADTVRLERIHNLTWLHEIIRDDQLIIFEADKN